MAQSSDKGTSQGFIFGGAADKDWTPRGSAYAASDSAFLFCVKCAGASKYAAPSQLKLNGKYNKNALYHNSDYGPVFGSDLHIGTTPGFEGVGARGPASFSNLGHAYTCPAGQYTSDPCASYLAGSYKFTVADYEVFVIEAV